MPKTLLPILFFLVLMSSTAAQKTTYFQQIGDLGGEEGLHIQTTTNYNLIAGSFQQTANIYGTPLQSKGNSDGWISLQNSNKTPIWTKQIASNKAIQLVDLQFDSLQNTIYALGSFADSLWIGKYSFYSPSNSIFLIKYSIEGKVLWVKIFGAAYFAKAAALHLSATKIHLTGTYRDSFQVDNIQLKVSTTKNAFILTLDNNGHLLRAYSFPEVYHAEGIALGSDEQGHLYWTGNFRGKLTTEQDSFLANVVYPDIFLCKLDTSGQLLWTRVFAGVYANEVTGFHYYNNHLYLAGQFMGLLNFGQHKLATAYRYYDLFIAKLDTLGNPIWAKKSNSSKKHTWLKKMFIHNQQIALVGGFEGYLEINDQQITAKGKIDGFYSQFSTQGELINLQGMGGKGNDFCQGVSTLGNQTTIIGTFQDSLNYAEQAYIANGFSDAFISSIYSNITTSTLPIATQFIEATVFPTPSQDSLFIQIENSNQLYWKLYNGNGQLVLEGNTTAVSLQTLTAGIYSLQINNEEGFAVLKVVKN